MAIEITPSEKGNKDATFACLAKDFSLDDKVLALITASPMDTLEDFRFYFAEEKEVDAFVALDTTLKDQHLRLQVSRLRRAWAAVRQMASRREARQTTSTAAELDDLLSEADLREVKIQFWMRYKLRYPADITPCDQIISRCHRELDRRMLTVYDMWKVRSLRHQVTTTRKRKQVGDGLFTFEEDAHCETAATVSNYMTNLHTYLLALAITGTVKKNDAPDKEEFGSDALKFVAAPWDVLEAYYFRATESVVAIPESSRMAWLERTDLAERAVWVSTFRDGEDTIGEVIKQTMDRRGAHWDPPALPPPTNYQQQPQKRDQQQPQRSPKGQAGKGGRPEQPRRPEGSSGSQSGHTQPQLKPGTVATELRNGSKLCPDFQKMHCKVRGPQCPKGLHKCGNVTPKGKICALNFHGASKCKTK